MPRVLAITHRRNYLLELRRQGFDVLDLPFPPGHEHVPPVDAALVDLRNLDQTRGALIAIRGRDARLPAVVIGVRSPEWLELEQDGRTLLVVPPVDFGQVASALRAMMSAAIEDETDPSPTVPRILPPPLVRHAPPVLDPPNSTIIAAAAPTAEPLADRTGSIEPAPTLPPEPDLATHHGGIRDESSVAAPLVAQLTGPVTYGSGVWSRQDGSPTPSGPWWKRNRRSRSGAGVGAARDATAVMAAASPDSWSATAETMLRGLDRVAPATDVCESLARELVTLATADAAAVLVVDQDRWYVVGGHGLRPLERALSVGAHDWLARHLSDPLPVVVIPDTDVLLAELSFAPLARFRCLFAVAVADGTALALVARNGWPFESTDVAAVLDHLRLRSPQLDESLQARRFARALTRFL